MHTLCRSTLAVVALFVIGDTDQSGGLMLFAEASFPTPAPAPFPFYFPTAFSPVFCDLGVENLSGTVCCPAACGTCGGRGCSQRPGGAANCCSGRITRSGIFCDDHYDTKCILPTVEVAEIFATDGEPGDEFGRAVAIDGDTLVVGAPHDDDGGENSGSAYVYIKSGSVWSFQAKLTASDATAYDKFGTSVAISGDRIVVGVPDDDSDMGSAYVYARSGTTWTQEAKLTASDGVAGDWFGFSVAMDGDTIIVGAPYDDHSNLIDSGSAYVFTSSGATWTEQTKLTATDAADSDIFGYSVGMDGDNFVVSAPSNDDAGSNSGSAYVFNRAGSTTFNQEAKLTASDAAAGDLFGYSVAMSGSKVVVGATRDDDGGTTGGSAYVFADNGAAWIQEDKLLASDAAVDDFFGYSVAIDGDSIVVGALFDGAVGSDTGSAYLFTFDGSSWSLETKFMASDPSANDGLGYSAAISSNVAVVGGYDSESAYVFE